MRWEEHDIGSRDNYIQRNLRNKRRRMSTILNIRSKTVQKIKSLTNNSLHNIFINYAHTFRFTNRFFCTEP